MSELVGARTFPLYLSTSRELLHNKTLLCLRLFSFSTASDALRLITFSHFSSFRNLSSNANELSAMFPPHSVSFFFFLFSLFPPSTPAQRHKTRIKLKVYFRARHEARINIWLEQWILGSELEWLEREIRRHPTVQAVLMLGKYCV